MKTKRILLSGLAVLLLLFGMSVRAGETNSESGRLSIAMARAPTLDRQSFLIIKEALDNAGYSTYVVQKAGELQESLFHVGIYIAPFPQWKPFASEESILQVIHFEDKLLAGCMNKSMGRYVDVNVMTLEKEHVFLQQGVPSVILRVPPGHFEKNPQRYKKAVVRGIQDYVDSM